MQRHTLEIEISNYRSIPHPKSGMVFKSLVLGSKLHPETRATLPKGGGLRPHFLDGWKCFPGPGGTLDPKSTNI